MNLDFWIYHIISLLPFIFAANKILTLENQKQQLHEDISSCFPNSGFSGSTYRSSGRLSQSKHSSPTQKSASLILRDPVHASAFLGISGLQGVLVPLIDAAESAHAS